MINAQDRLAELDTVLEYMDDGDWVKIPDNVIFYIKENKNKDHDWKYDESKSLEDQDLHKDTFSLLTFISYKYIATPKEKEKMKELFQENTNILSEKYSVDNIFKQPETKIENIIEETSTETVALVPTTKETIFSKIISFFKNLFNKNK